MASTYRYHDMGTPTLRTKFTWSIWCKRSELGGYMTLASMWKDSNDHVVLRFDNTDQLRFYYSESSGGSQDLKTNAVYRDTAAWYHIVATFDSTQSTSSDRAKLYVNGEQITSFATETYPSQNEEPDANVSGTDHYLGARGDGHNYGGLMSHCHFVDGAVYAASTFGSTDSSTGEWKINTAPTISEYGTNGWFMFKDDASLTDRSGKSNNFTNQSGTLTQTEDCPSNVFATFNPLSGADTMAVNSTFSNGNNTVVCSGTVYNAFGSTLGVNKGKFYAEFKTNVNPGDGMIGVFAKYGGSSNYLGSQTHQYSWYNASGGKFASNSSNLATSVGTYTTNDIIGIALDCDNNKLYYHKNGTYMTYGGGTMNPTSGTYGISITDPADTDLGFYFMSAMDWGGGTRGNWSANFGNGYFGTSAISSEGTNASGIGKFEYDVPAGYTALCTKGLNE